MVGVAALAAGPLIAFDTQTVPPEEELARALRANVVRLEGPSPGFGFIVGQRGTELFIVTANHVIEGPDGVAQEIAVRLFRDQFRPLSASPAGLSHTRYDVAVVRVELAREYEWIRESISLADARRGTAVWFVGRNQEWVTPAVEGRVNALTAERTYRVDGLAVSPGSSGAPVFSEMGIIGMVVGDRTGGPTDVVSIRVIKELLEENNLPFDLVGRDRVALSGTRGPLQTPGNSERRRFRWSRWLLGGLTLAFSSWAIDEDLRARRRYDAYQAASTSEEALRLRREVEQSRGRRNQGAAAAAVAAGALALTWLDPGRSRDVRSEAAAPATRPSPAFTVEVGGLMRREPALLVRLAF